MIFEGIMDLIQLQKRNTEVCRFIEMEIISDFFSVCDKFTINISQIKIQTPKFFETEKYLKRQKLHL